MRDGAKTLLADSGFGVLQVIPLILSSINTDKEYQFELNAHCYNKKVVVIEEPETNLHPALQSKLADMFFESATTFNIQFIIETHSEYLIRKFQYLTAKPGNNFYTDDTVIYYLSSNHELGGDEPRVRKININGDGTLTDDFGSGFFDEADKIALELFLLNKSQGN
jgi:predicted ATPase